MIAILFIHEQHIQEVTTLPMPPRSSDRSGSQSNRTPHSSETPSLMRRRSAPRRVSAPKDAQPSDSLLPPVLLGRYPFAQVTTRWEALPHSGGLFAILDRLTEPGSPYRPRFLDEADDIVHALATLHTRALLPQGEMKTRVYAALPTELVKAARRQIVTELRTLYQLPATLSPSPPPPSSLPLPRRLSQRKQGTRRARRVP